MAQKSAKFSKTKTAPAKGAPKTVLFCGVRNEAPFLLEWIAYHRAIGFDEIVICSNPSSDGTEEILAAMADAGVIRHLKSPLVEGKSPQKLAANAFKKLVGFDDGTVYLWLDADEFLNIHVGARTVQELVAAMGDARGVLINWRIFGSASQTKFEGRFIDPIFSRAADAKADANREVKTLFRAGDGVIGFGNIGIHRPLLDGARMLSAAEFLCGSGAKASNAEDGNVIWVAGANSRATARVSTEEFGWSLAQINHYAVRTPEYFRLKALRGRGWGPYRAQKTNNRHTDVFFARFDRNEAEDTSILIWKDAVTAEITRYMALVHVAEAVSQSQLLVEDSLHKTAADAAAQNRATHPFNGAQSGDKPLFELTFPWAEKTFVKEMYAKADVILEYGSGGSTVLAASLGRQVFSVESDKDWAAALSEHLAGISDLAKVHYTNIGPTGDWGKPTSGAGFARYHKYALSVWDRPDFVHPDLVLIDGRFRAACLVAVMLRAQKPTTVLIDDYDDRPYYHGVENLTQKEQQVGRIAKFTVTPGPLPAAMVTQAIGWFNDSR
jgi:hypothetical protein